MQSIKAKAYWSVAETIKGRFEKASVKIVRDISKILPNFQSLSLCARGY